ncbi:hypothetical protein [Ponticoccus alexandrii]|uniref:Lipoprotein n=1 Tax=Ponticoccus alexandrii TaxID=1943633 RepID=A0ABX7FD29_9RHOB|nr:hypothetical protein [Ponticoccus alexandrii]ETA49281.1 lipoprotein [Rhodobacteraceae bacterium PD-2]QRF67756.1 hypothetical protein GQA70_16455 [Ponticoccus alexandrii]
MTIRALFAALACAVLVSGCAGNVSGPNATAEEAARAAYRHDGPPEITLYTMINNRSDAGAHTAMMINAPSQRVVFDPAGSVRFQSVPEIDDVLYGITPEVEEVFESAHARETYRVRIQKTTVAPEVAERALQLVQGHGAVPAAQCSKATSAILRQLPGFQSIGSQWYPNNLADDFARLPGVTERVRREMDDDDKSLAVKAYEERKRNARLDLAAEG